MEEETETNEFQARFRIFVLPGKPNVPKLSGDTGLLRTSRVR